MPTTSRIVTFALALLAPHAALSQDADRGDDPPLNGGRVALQVGTGALLTPIGFVAGGLTTRWVARRFGASDDAASRAAYVGAWTTAALATAAGPTFVGSRGRVTGSYLAALGGAVAGGAFSFVLVRLNDRKGDAADPPCRIVCAVSAVAVFLLPAIGATVGYDLTREYEK